MINNEIDQGTSHKRQWMNEEIEMIRQFFQFLHSELENLSYVCHKRKVNNENDHQGLSQKQQRLQVKMVSFSKFLEFLKVQILNSLWTVSSQQDYIIFQIVYYVWKKKNRWALQKFWKLKTATKKKDEIIKRLTKV